MCLSTAYYESKDENNVAARYVSEIRINGKEITLTDVMGMEIKIEGSLTYVDLTGGTVLIHTEE